MDISKEAKLKSEQAGFGYENTITFVPESRASSLMERIQKSAEHHFDEHVKLQKAASFLKAHPEFEEFIQLVRSGSIQL